jgi:hypothetical protein
MDLGKRPTLHYANAGLTLRLLTVYPGGGEVTETWPEGTGQEEMPRNVFSLAASSPALEPTPNQQELLQPGDGSGMSGEDATLVKQWVGAQMWLWQSRQWPHLPHGGDP